MFAGPAASRSIRRARPARQNRAGSDHRQAAASGVDVGNNGRATARSVFLYVQRRMSGFGDSWTRWPRGDVERFRY